MRALFLALSLLASVPAFAQESRVILSSVTIRDREGVSALPSATIPAFTAQELIAPPIVDEVVCRIIMPTEVYEDPTTSFRVNAYKFDAPGFWRRIASATFRGGHYVDEDGNVNPPFEMSLGSGGIRGRELRCELESSVTIRWAGEMEHWTAIGGSR